MMIDSSETPFLPLALTALAAGLGSGALLLAYSVFSPRCQFWGPVIRSLPQRDAVALTFDDGPHPDFTPRILDTLAAANVTATFFVIGRFAKQHPALTRRIHAEGHTLGNHTRDHDYLGINHGRAYWDAQIADTQNIIADLTGQRPVLFRPPMGFKTWHVAAAAKAARLGTVGWSVRGYDTRPVSPDVLAKKMLAKTSGHDILLLHDGIAPSRKNGTQSHTADALPQLLAGIREKGLTVTSLVDALLAGVAVRNEIVERVRERAAS